MDCSSCKSKLQIFRSYYKAIQDDVPDLPTLVYCCQELSCLNQSCEQYGVIKDTIRHQLELEVSE